MIRVVNHIGVSLGSDPELFLSKEGKIIGSEKVIPEKGVVPEGWSIAPVIRDGVQVEFNVPANNCRQSFSSNLRECFRALVSVLPKGVSVVFSQTVEVTPEEMATLHPKSQQFGCATSFNAYGKEPMTISDASQYYHRSAGGHIHLGLPEDNHPAFKRPAPEHMVTVLDILLGNTCVLLDRDKGNVERRKVYGKAGEYRLPKHGLEYRVLSNFWLRSYQTMSFVMALARFAVSVSYNKEISEELIKLVSLDDIRSAINNNDYDLALENFKAIKDFVQGLVSWVPPDRKYDPNQDAAYPLEGARMEAFMYFMEKGLDHWFTEDTLTHWLKHDYHERRGWETFADEVVKEEMPAHLKIVELVTA